MAAAKHWTLAGLALLAVGGALTGCAVAMRQQMSEKKAAIESIADQCREQIQADHSLDPLRNKMELWRVPTAPPPPFEIISNDTFPNDDERPLIAHWAKIADACVARASEQFKPPPAANATQRVVFEQDISYSIDAYQRIQQLTLALYEQKLTYGEFAQQRYQITSQAAAAERDYRQAVIARDQQRQIQIAQQFSTALAAWSSYVQAVNSRQPQTVYINGTIRVQ
jgi:hypothetical protein